MDKITKKDWKTDWTPTPKDVAKQPSKIISGHRMCPGCPAGEILKLASKALPKPENTIIVNATGCVEVCVSRSPYQSWTIPWIHNAFENAPATASGILGTFEALKGRGKWKDEVPNILVIAGDGATYDIGIQSLSGAIERGENFTYLAYDNEAYSNTGIQRSGATPHAASTTTTPVGDEICGKPRYKKPIDFIVSSHLNSYAATVTPHHWQDLMKKIRRAMLYKGPAFVHALSPCPTGWGYDPEIGVELSKLAVQTTLFPLLEFDPEKWKYTLTSETKKLAENSDKILPIEEYLKPQKRFKHLFKPEKQENIINHIQERVEQNWNYLLKLVKHQSVET